MKRVFSVFVIVLMLIPTLSVAVCADDKPLYEVGDLNGDGALTNSDAIYLLYNSIFGDVFYPLNQPCDFNGNERVDNADAIYLLYHTIFPNDYPIPPKSPFESSPTAQDVAKEMGLGINLGNTMESYWSGDGNYDWVKTIGKNTPQNYETCWGAVVTTKEAIFGMRDAGFNTVRIPVYWGNMMKNDGKWQIHPDYLARVAEIVDYCQEAGLYAVINIHHFDEFIVRRYDNDESAKIFEILWTQIAEYFKDYPYTVVFEGYNENMGGNKFDENDKLVERSDSEAYDLTNRCNQAFVDAVRSTGGNNSERVLIVSGYWTNIDKTTSGKFKMPTDTVKDRLMVSVHYVDNSMYWSNRIGSQKWLDYIDNQCDKLDKAFTSKGIPVFMGETTSRYPNDKMAKNAIHKEPVDCVKIVLNELLDRGYVPVLWDTSNNFYSRTNCIIENSDEAKMIKEIAESIE